METYAVEEGAVGTPDYIAPEVFLSTGYGNAHLPNFIFQYVCMYFNLLLLSGAEVDWWALGCMTYEFLVGITPFYGETCEEIFENIMNNSIDCPLPFLPPSLIC